MTSRICKVQLDNLLPVKRQNQAETPNVYVAILLDFFYLELSSQMQHFIEKYFMR